jgi:hypothetical protein
MEPRFSRDLGGVRAHIDRTAAAAAAAVGAAAFTVGLHIVFGDGRYQPGTAPGRRLLAHELAHVVQQGHATDVSGPFSLSVRDDPAERQAREVAAGTAVAAPVPNGGTVIARSAAEDLIDEHTSIANLDETALGRDLLARALAGDVELVDRVLDELGSRNRDDVSLAFLEAATESDLISLVGIAAGRALLDRCYDEVTSGSVGADEKRHADRVIAAKATRIPAEEYAKGAQAAKIFPFKLPGLTVFDDAPINARRRPGGMVWVEQPVRVLGDDDYRAETRTLPASVFTSGIELPENEIVGVKMYDLGGEVIYRPATYLVEVANMADTKVLMTAGEAFFVGATLGSGALVSGGASVGARVLLAADRAAFTLGLIASALRDHRGWIIERFGDRGRVFLEYVDIINSAVALYGGGRALVGMGQLVAGFAKALRDWRAATRAAATELSAAERQVLQQVDEQAERVLADAQAIRNEQTAASSSTEPAAPGKVLGPPAPETAASKGAAATKVRPEEVSAAPRPVSGEPESAGEMQRLRQLGQERPGKFRQNEMETAIRIERQLGVRLRRSTDPAVDWLDGQGRTYDAVGGFDGRFFEQQWPNLQTRIMDHLAKADFVPVDVALFYPAQIAQVREFIKSLGPRVFLVGI